MNARIIKETKSLLPVFCVTVLASLAPSLLWNHEIASGVGLAVFTICGVMMGASCFGNEYQWRTMPLLLAQPVSRRRIWNEKMLVLGSALALGFVVFLVCVPLTDGDAYLFLLMIPPCVFCVAPYMALTIKNTIMAAVLTFGLPCGLCGVLALSVWTLSHFFPNTGQRLDNAIGNHPYPWIGTAAASYCAVCYLLGYRTFLKLQAVDVQALEIALPAGMEMVLAKPLRRLLPGYSGPWASLFRKELLIQKPTFLVAGALCVASPVMALAWHLNHSDISAGLNAAIIAILVFVIPFIATGISVAEERAWGVSGWQLALPVRARKQWAAKMLTVIFTTVLLGVALPTLLWISDGWVFHLPIGPGPGHGHFNSPTPAEFNLEIVTLLDWVLGYLLVLGLGVFTSSLCANSARAIVMNIGLITLGAGLTIAIISGITRVFEVFGPRSIGANELPISALFRIGAYCLGLLGLAQYLAGFNYRNGEPSSRRAWTQMAVVVGSAASLAVDLWTFLYWS